MVNKAILVDYCYCVVNLILTRWSMQNSRLTLGWPSPLASLFTLHREAAISNIFNIQVRNNKSEKKFTNISIPHTERK